MSCWIHSSSLIAHRLTVSIEQHIACSAPHKQPGYAEEPSSLMRSGQDALSEAMPQCGGISLTLWSAAEDGGTESLTILTRTFSLPWPPQLTISIALVQESECPPSAYTIESVGRCNSPFILPFHCCSIALSAHKSRCLLTMILCLIAALALGAAAGPVSKRQAPAGVPQYVLDYAPMVYLHTQETYFPSDIGAQIVNTQPEYNFTLVPNIKENLTLNNIDLVGFLAPPREIYLTSLISPDKNPAYLNGIVPDDTGKTNGAASSVIIVNDHGSGIVDVFYFYFYAFNWGGFYFGQPVGLHVGDWEHTMTRFVNGTPTDIWFSQHSNGQAFTYEALEKYDYSLRVSSPTGSLHASLTVL